MPMVHVTSDLLQSVGNSPRWVQLENSMQLFTNARVVTDVVDVPEASRTEEIRNMYQMAAAIQQEQFHFAIQQTL